MSFIPIAKMIPHDPVAMVEVIAPSDLKEGFQFEAVYDGVRFHVTVPLGGVVKGQKLLVPVKVSDNDYDDDILIQADSIESESLTGRGTTTTTTTNNNTNNGYGIGDIIIESSGNNNHGRWRAGFLDCFELGPLHPTLCNAIFCQPILLGQILTRMKLTMFAYPEQNESNNHKNSTFKKVLLLFVGYWILTTIVFVADPVTTTDSTILDSDGQEVILEPTKTTNGKIHGSLLFWFHVYCVFIMMKLRKLVREKYQINGGNIIKDVVASVLCSICTVSQLARETAEYYDNNAMWCSHNGLRQQQQYQPEMV